MQLASLWRRLASMFYDALLLMAWLFVAGFMVVGLIPGAVGERSALVQMGFQTYLVMVAGGYFVLFWVRGGQTLAMKTWHIRVVTREGAALSWRRAWLRYFWALATLGLGIAWALVDRERQFLHDHLAGTRVVKVEPRS
jgi:uncharacterized RDD family membrane protein YckC